MKSVEEMINSELKLNNDSKIFCTILTLLDYSMYCRKIICTGGKLSDYKGIMSIQHVLLNDEEDIFNVRNSSLMSEIPALFALTKITLAEEKKKTLTDKESILDGIIALTINLIFEFDYFVVFKDVFKDCPKEENKFGNIIRVLKQYIDKARSKKTLQKIDEILEDVFTNYITNKKNLFSPIIYASILSSILDFEFQPNN